jgi:hypothetical protein
MFFRSPSPKPKRATRNTPLTSVHFLPPVFLLPYPSWPSCRSLSLFLTLSSLLSSLTNYLPASPQPELVPEKRDESVSGSEFSPENVVPEDELCDISYKSKISIFFWPPFPLPSLLSSSFVILPFPPFSSLLLPPSSLLNRTNRF